MDIALDTVLRIGAGILTASLIWIFRNYIFRFFRTLNEKRKARKLGRQIYKNGLTKFHFSRDDYGRTLSSFLDGANKTIEIVSVSLKVTNEIGNLTDYLEKRYWEIKILRLEFLFVILKIEA